MSEFDRVLLRRPLLLPLLMLALASSFALGEGDTKGIVQEAQRPGKCPSPSLVEPGALSCSADNECGEGNQKCCKAQDGNSRCAAPEGISCGDGNQRCCRNLDVNSRCIDDDPKPEECPSPSDVPAEGPACTADMDCDDNEKCCKSEDGRGRCVVPRVSKPGKCPSPSVVESGYSNCESDGDCGDNNRKCCKNHYGNTRCAIPDEKLGQCRQRSFSDEVCSPGEIVDKCQGSDARCWGSLKCCRTARCVTSCEEPEVQKSGTCPPPTLVGGANSNCAVDSDCTGNRKCCENKRGNTRCAVPNDKPGQCPQKTRALPVPTCSGTELTGSCRGQDTLCGGTKKCCRTAQCFTCLEPDRQTPGKCPAPSNVQSGNSNCQKDGDCEDDKKCCANQGGNTRCVFPSDKPGQCRRRVFKDYGCAPDRIMNTCRGDDTFCPGSLKCCRTTPCVTSCEQPGVPKPGKCPSPSVVESGYSNCESDGDCGDNNRKCCKNHYGNTRCAEPDGKPGHCRRRSFSDEACSPDEVVNTCQGSDARCPGSLKCCRTARCVTSCEEPEGPKAGKCPDPSKVQGNQRCKKDSDCGDGNRKCCINRQGRKRCSAPQKEKQGRCRPRLFVPQDCPQAPPSSCRGDDFRCSGSKKCCQTGPCSFSCENPFVPGPGNCPDPSLVSQGYTECAVDANCGHENKKCCVNQEGKKRCAFTGEKPGQCRRRFFPAQLCLPGEVVNKCQGNDTLCPGSEKCCRTARCVISCEEPDAPKPGSCPSVYGVEPGHSTCEKDSDCGHDYRKCCKNREGNRRCTTPQGQCPDTSDVVGSCEIIPGVSCEHQKQCSKGKLCCPYGCGKRCLQPAY